MSRKDLDGLKMNQTVGEEEKRATMKLSARQKIQSNWSLVIIGASIILILQSMEAFGSSTFETGDVQW